MLEQYPFFVIFLIMIILECFFAMIAVSVIAKILGRYSKSDSEFLFALKYVPLFCIAMACVAFFASIVNAGIIISIPEPFWRVAFWGYFIIPFVVLAFFFWLYVKFVQKKKRNLRKSILHFWSVFGLSLTIVIAIFSSHILYATTFWRQIDLPTNPVCKLELRRAFTFCPEFERRVCFTSGKKIAIQFDTCGLDKFNVYELKNGNIFLENSKDWGESYIVDSKNEKVSICLPNQEIVNLLKDKKFIGNLDRKSFKKYK